MMAKNRARKIILVLVLATILGLNFGLAKPAHAVLGVADVSVTTVIADIPQTLFNISKKIAEQFFRIYKRRLLTMLQNDLVNWVQGGGKPRFVTDPKKFFADAADTAAAQAIDNFFSQKGADICSPFKANLQLLVERNVFLTEDRARCTLGDIKKVHLDSFRENFNNGGWRTWIALHETSNTLPGTYLAAIETISGNVSRAGNTATAQLSAGGGFLDQKNCLIYQIRTASEELLEGGDFLALSAEQQEEFAQTGNVTETVDVRQPPYSKRDGIPINEVPNNATCIRSNTITPGSVIGDQISGALKATGIDKLVNAKEIGEILDAVIDAAINRTAREGLALMKSGRGSYTKPQAGSYKDRAKIQADTQGLEGVQAAELLNTAISLKNKVDSLEGLLNKFTANPNREEPFRNWLKAMPGTAGSFTCSEKKAPGAAAKIERCFYNWNNNGNFNEENNNPGPYLANTVILEELGNLWKKIKDEAFTPKNNLSCSSAPFASYTLHPDQDDLPIIGGDGSGFVWEKADPYYKALELTKKQLNSGSLYAAIAEAESNTASHRLAADAYNTLKQQNEQVKTQISADKKFINETLPALTLYTTILMDYDTAGRDITVNGIATNLAAVIKEYTETLGGRDDAAVETAKRKLELARRAIENKWRGVPKRILDIDTGIVIPNPGEFYGAEDIVRAKEKLPVIEKAIALISASKSSLPQNAIVIVVENGREVEKNISTSELSPGDIIVVKPNAVIPVDGTIVRCTSTDKSENNKCATAGRPGTKMTAGDRNTDKETLEIKVINIINESDQITISPSEAVAQAMLDLKLTPASIDQITNELELRESKVSKQQTDTANKLGKFPTNTEERVQAGLDSGNNEWEKYFYNRTQYAYSSIIYDYYKNRFKCE